MHKMNQYAVKRVADRYLVSTSFIFNSFVLACFYSKTRRDLFEEVLLYQHGFCILVSYVCTLFDFVQRAVVYAR
eukprot:c37039_g1_i1 orf=134-355(+)